MTRLSRASRLVHALPFQQTVTLTGDGSLSFTQRNEGRPSGTLVINGEFGTGL